MIETATRTLPADAITVAICTYNNAPLLARTLESIERLQVDPTVNWSVLVVDNNCTDHTRQVVQEHFDRKKLPGLRIVSETQQGLTYSRRRAVLETTASLIAFVDDDCQLSANWIQEMVDFFAEHSNAGAVGGQVELHWETEPTPDALRLARGYAKQDYGNDRLQLTNHDGNHLVGAGLVLRRQALLDSKWTERSYLSDRAGTRLTAGGDTEIIIRIRQCGYELWYTPAAVLQHFVPERRMTLGYLCRLYRGFGESEVMLRTLARGKPADLVWRMRLLKMACAYLGRRSAAFLVHDLVLRRPVDNFRRVQIYEALGQVSSAWRLLWKGLPV